MFLAVFYGLQPRPKSFWKPNVVPRFWVKHYFIVMSFQSGWAHGMYVRVVRLCKYACLLFLHIAQARVMIKIENCCRVLTVFYGLQSRTLLLQIANFHKKKITCCDFTNFEKKISADLHNFRFQWLNMLHIQNSSNCCIWSGNFTYLLAEFWHLAQRCAFLLGKI